ncbi:hypothetical protein C7445_10553 [Alicyclobacillus sacchari]|uniref:Uncharacterized protein n=1 Tax=Alicyclobacillus sacchari TaxID=392010 RepID=A0A4R8LQX3_9BACL|nr:hypothetical protein [Alicyclobacillus sacchari]TDY47875.1 hypothetical protein C7445_10553 [Alicyclobacillus sacchari]GMA55968.1 hypothetical protein GCM10025858_04710 [Alicyclobacillus sacchari]
MAQNDGAGQPYTWYDWYEVLEEPLWFEQGMGLLPWWLRKDSSEEVQWFINSYPVLAPYYPVGSLLEQDWLGLHVGYWWP